MSTIVVVRKEKQIAIGADTLTKLGYVRESADYIAQPSKIIHIGQSYIATVGHASFGLVLEDYFSRLEDTPALDTPLSIFRAAQQLHQALKDDYFVETDSDGGDFESSQLQALIANPHGIFGLYRLRSVQEYTRFYSFGSGSEFALGAMHATYKVLPDAAAIAHAGLSAATEFDDATSEPFDIETIELLKS